MFDVTVKIDRGVARLKKLPDQVRAELRTEARALATDLQSAAKANAGEYFHVVTGRYQRSIRRSVRSNSKGVVGKVYSKSPLAHILEKGAVRPAHQEIAKNVKALAFIGSGGAQQFAASVMNPGSRVEGHAVINDAFQEMKGRIREGLQQAVARGTAASQAQAT